MDKQEDKKKNIDYTKKPEEKKHVDSFDILVHHSRCVLKQILIKESIKNNKKSTKPKYRSTGDNETMVERLVNYYSKERSDFDKNGHIDIM